jgi:chlorobactene glucosyltransferase
MAAVLPEFVTGGVMEACVISNLCVVALCLLPLYLVRRTRLPVLSVGAGVGNLVSKKALDAAGAFASISAAVVDDVALGIRVKASGGKVLPVLARSWVRVRMYSGAVETMRGFTKNIYPGLDVVGPVMLVIPFGLGSVINFVPYLGLAGMALTGAASLPTVLSLSLMHLTLVIMTAFCRLAWPVALLSPLRELAWWWITIRSMLEYHRRGVSWRGRRYP